ncbi:MAG: hypothetical protein JKY54_04175, partial [Flavobacteriales bacterium]|nr:hypothetical protein [Flavobacteriales bacterium]
FQTSKIRFILIITTLFQVSVGIGQDSVRTVLEPNFLFRYDIEEIEDPDDGIIIYNQYCPGLSGEIYLRQDQFKHVAEKEHVDYYANGKMLHKGYYENGSLMQFKNYFPNSQIERELKIKRKKPKQLTCYYMFGEIRERQIFDDGILMLHEKYHFSGRLKYLMEVSEIGYLKIEQWNDEDGKPLKYIELLNEDSLKYEIAEMYLSGTIKEKGIYLYNPKTETFERNGKVVKYSQTGTLMAEAIYANDKVVDVIIDEKSQAELITEANMSTVPVNFLAFDLNNDGEISYVELNESVNSFFDEDSTTTLAQLNGLVNYFFEQD